MQKAINLGIIGIGYWGSLLVKKFSSLPRVNLPVVSDLKKTYPGIKTVRNYKKILENTNVDAVVVATPVLTHYEITKDALLAGKHVFVEKPFVKTSKQTRELVMLARRKNLVLMTNYIYLYHPAIQKIKKLIDSGKLGRILFVHSVRLGLELFPKGVDVIWDLAPHDVALIYYLLGKKPSKITLEKSALINKNTPDTAFINFSFSNNLATQIMISWLCPTKVRHFAVGGTKGTVVFDETRQDKLLFFNTKVDKSFGKHKIFQPEREGKKIPFSDKEPLIAACSDFINSITSKREPLAGAEISIKTVEILEKTR